jgi:hypothetical protein
LHSIFTDPNLQRSRLWKPPFLPKLSSMSNVGYQMRTSTTIHHGFFQTIECDAGDDSFSGKIIIQKWSYLDSAWKQEFEKPTHGQSSCRKDEGWNILNFSWKIFCPSLPMQRRWKIWVNKTALCFYFCLS